MFLDIIEAILSMESFLGSSEAAAVSFRLQDGMSLSDLPAPPPHPTDPEEVT